MMEQVVKSIQMDTHWINVNKVDRKKQNYTSIKSASFWLGDKGRVWREVGSECGGLNQTHEEVQLQTVACPQGVYTKSGR